MALTGAILLVVALLLRPMDIWPVVARLHTLETFSAITAIGIGLEVSRRRHEPGRSPQLSWLAAFCVFFYLVTFARLGLGDGFRTAWAITLGPLFMVLVCYALRTIDRLRTTMGVLVVCFTCVSAVTVHQGLQPRQCIELRENIEDPGEEPDRFPEGRACEGGHACEADGILGSDYACERLGLFGTMSTLGRVRWRGQLDDPNEVAVMLGSMLPFLLMFARDGAKNTLLCLVAAGLALWAVVYTQSRGGQIVVATALMVVLTRRYGWKSIFIVAILTAPLVALSWRSDPDADSSSMERAEILGEGLGMLRTHPLVGIGISQFARENPMNMAAHNSYLLVATELGIPGFLCWCGMLWTTIKIPIVIALRPPAGIDPKIVSFAEALAASLLGCYIGVFFLSFVYKNTFFVWIGLAGALYGAVRQHDPTFEIHATRRDAVGIVLLAIFSLIFVRIAAGSAH